MRTITIKEYDQTWTEEFKRIKSMLFPLTDDLIADIVHIGSTSVPGLRAEPIIDVNIVIGSYDVLPALTERLESLGYIAEGAGTSNRGRFRKDKPGPVTHYIYVCRKGSADLMRHIAFRDYLIKHPDAAEEYGMLKSFLAVKFPADADSYAEGKRAFIERTIEKAMVKGPRRNVMIQETSGRV